MKSNSNSNGSVARVEPPPSGAVSRYQGSRTTFGDRTIASGLNLGNILRHRWHLILGVLVPTVALTAAYTYLHAPRLYESEASFLVESRAPEAASPLALLDRIGSTGRVENEVELLRSRRVLAPTAEQLASNVTVEMGRANLRPGDVLPGFRADRQAPVGVYRVSAVSDSIVRVQDAQGNVLTEAAVGDTVSLEGLSWWLEAAPSKDVELTVADFEGSVDAVRSAITVQRVGRDADLIKLTCSATEAELARELCLAVSGNYLALRTELQVSEAANARDWLADAAERIKERLTAAEDSLADYSRRQGAVALESRAQEEVRNLTSLAAARDLLRAERVALGRYLDQISIGTGGSEKYRDLANFPTFLRNEAVGDLVSNLIQLDNRRSELSVLRTEANPELAAIDTRIGDIERQLLSITRSYEAGLATQIESYEETLRTSRQRVAAIPTQQVEFLRRQRQVVQLEQMYTTLENRRREAELAEGVGMPNVRQIDEPGLPRDPSSPRPLLNLALGSVLGLGLGLLLAGYREYSDVRLRSRDEVEFATGATVIGMLPSVGRPRPLLAEPAEFAPGGALQRLRRAGSGVAAPLDDKERQPAVEAFRTLLADLRIAMRGTKGEGSRRTIAVVSSAQGEGKTYTACNLALVWASVGKRALLVDTDLRVGRVARFLGLEPDVPGFAEFLIGEVHPSNAFREVRVTGGHTLHVLTAGRAGVAAADRFHLEGRISEAFEYLARGFDVVVIDTPPLNLVSDATVVAAAAEAAVLVVRAGVTRPDALEMALSRLQRADCDPIGLVLNDVNLPSYYAGYYAAEPA